MKNQEWPCYVSLFLAQVFHLATLVSVVRKHHGQSKIVTFDAVVTALSVLLLAVYGTWKIFTFAIKKVQPAPSMSEVSLAKKDINLANTSGSTFNIESAMSSSSPCETFTQNCGSQTYQSPTLTNTLTCQNIPADKLSHSDSSFVQNCEQNEEDVFVVI